MKIKKFFDKKKPAQAMVEFAIALPVLLMLLYGILEAGRFLFIYSSIVTASRQAVRYASATGEGLTTTVARYDDCDGIRAAAERVDYLNAFTPANIHIYHDTGPGSGPTPYCAGPTDGWAPTTNNYRILVRIDGNFNPIVPKLVPFITRTVANGHPVTAESARSLLYSVPIVVDQAPIIVPQSPTTTEITVNPEPSDIGQQVTITVRVSDQDDATNTPSGVVEVTGTESSCVIALVEVVISGIHYGSGTCTVSFSTSGDFTLTGIYTPNDEDHLPSQGSTIHHVNLPATTTTIIQPADRESVLRNNPVVVAVTVTGGSTTPTGTVDIDAGGSARCSFTLVGGAGSCVLSFNNTGDRTINASYSGDSTHQPSTAPSILIHVVDVTNTPRPTATITPIPSPTSSPTPTLSPTPNATPVASCAGITHGTIRYSGNNMTMTVTNPFTFALTMNNVTVWWNDDKGHKTGSDKTLKLVAAWVNGAPFWTGRSTTGQSSMLITATPLFPPGTSTITFTFDKSYDNPETTDRIYINWLTPGCESNFVDSSQ